MNGRNMPFHIKDRHTEEKRKKITYMHMAATTTRPDRPLNPVSNSTSLLRFLPLTIL